MSASEEPLPQCEFHSDKLVVSIDTTLTAKVERINPVVEGIMEILRDTGSIEGEENVIDLALREALANAIVHGCRRDPGKKIRVCVAVEEGLGLLIVVSDPGGGFDPQEIPSPVMGQNVFRSQRAGHFSDQPAHG